MLHSSFYELLMMIETSYLYFLCLIARPVQVIGLIKIICAFNFAADPTSWRMNQFLLFLSSYFMIFATRWPA